MMRLFRKARPTVAALRLRPAVLSRPGSYTVNEDAAGTAVASGHTLLIVADGLGGHGRGEVASQLAVERAVELFRQHPTLDAQALAAVVHGAHRAVRNATRPDRATDGPRTTLTLLVSTGGEARWAHVGDSRVYLFQEGRVHARTRDHSVPEMLHRAGEIGDDEIRHHPDRSRLLQALGQESDPRVTVSELTSLRAGDAVLLCSDGWWENVPEAQMEASLRLARRPEEWLRLMSETIVAAAQMPQDNYTAVAAFVS